MLISLAICFLFPQCQDESEKQIKHMESADMGHSNKNFSDDELNRRLSSSSIERGTCKTSEESCIDTSAENMGRSNNGFSDDGLDRQPETDGDIFEISSKISSVERGTCSEKICIDTSAESNSVNNSKKELGLEDGFGPWWAGPLALVRTPVMRKINFLLGIIWMLQGVVYLGIPLSSDAFR